MAYEIERKFLLKNDSWRAHVQRSIGIQQAYICNTNKASIRVRIADQKAFFSSKTMTKDIRRHEFEYEIPLHDAEFMILNMCQDHSIIKTRHLVQVENHVWEIDEFHGENSGLIVAEIELDDEKETFHAPTWLGSEVSNEARYYNMSLLTIPYNQWTT